MEMLDLILSGLLLLISVLDIIIYKNKKSLIKFIIGLLVSLMYLAFEFIDIVKPYVLYHEILASVIIIIYLLIFIPKKVTKNLTEYDYFELEENYKELKEDRELLRKRFLSTMELIDEGMIFYEDDIKTVILSEYALKLFGGSPKRKFSEHKEMIFAQDRDSYDQALRVAVAKQRSYEIKYRLSENKDIWIIEKGTVMNASKVDSIIATVRPINVSEYKKSTYFDVDALPSEAKLNADLKEYLLSPRAFALVQFELSNLPSINEKYSREIGSLMMNEYIRFFKNHYLNNITKLYRVTGSRFVGLIDNTDEYQRFHEALTNSNSELYNLKLSVASAKETIKPNFSVIKVTSHTSSSSVELLKLSTKLLKESIESRKRNYTILNN